MISALKKNRFFRSFSFGLEAKIAIVFINRYQLVTQGSFTASLHPSGRRIFHCFINRVEPLAKAVR